LARNRRRSPVKAPPLTRTERRDLTSHRRGVAALVASVVAAGVILVAWFPAGALLAQNRTLAQASTSLEQLRAQDRALQVESKNLATPSEIARIARQQFQLIAPGEQAYQVLPPPGTTGGSTDPYSGDPGNSAPVSPSAKPELPPGSVQGGSEPSTAPTTSAGTKTKGHSPSPAGGGSPGLFTLVLHTLEFWR
jgi:cell division protein FtsB